MSRNYEHLSLHDRWRMDSWDNQKLEPDADTIRRQANEQSKPGTEEPDETLILFGVYRYLGNDRKLSHSVVHDDLVTILRISRDWVDIVSARTSPESVSVPKNWFIRLFARAK